MNHESAMLTVKAGETSPRSARRLLRITAAVAIFGLAVTAPVQIDMARAETHTDGGHEAGGGQGRGGPAGGGHADGEEGDHGGSGGRGVHGDGEDQSGGHDDGGGQGGNRGQQGQGQGPRPGGDGNGQRRGDGAGAGGRPVWAQEGIPEVELGRLNVARSPERVLDRAYDEALSNFSEEVAAFYRLDLESMERELSTNWDNVTFIDSPLQNLALFRDALDGSSVLRDAGVMTDNDTLLAAFLGTASDKTIPVTSDTAKAISMILGQPLDAAAAAALAEKAERIRLAIAEGHG